jgi:hypothetical protein
LMEGTTTMNMIMMRICSRKSEQEEGYFLMLQITVVVGNIRSHNILRLINSLKEEGKK